MRRFMSPILCAGLAALPAFSQSHLNVAPGKFVQLAFNHKAGDPANVFSSMVQISNDGSLGSGFSIPFGQALVITDVSLESSVPSGYQGSADGFVSLRWYINNQQTATSLYSESFKANAAPGFTGFSRSFTAGRIFSYYQGHSPCFIVSTPWDAAFGNLRIMCTGYVIAYP